MSEDDLKNNIKHIKKEIIENYEKIDKSYSRSLIFETISFLVILIFILIFFLNL